MSSRNPGTTDPDADDHHLAAAAGDEPEDDAPHEEFADVAGRGKGGGRVSFSRPPRSRRGPRAQGARRS
jgi:hypothetical protein